MIAELSLDRAYNITGFCIEACSLERLDHLAFAEVSKVAAGISARTLGLHLGELCEVIACGKLLHNLFCLRLGLY